LGRDVRIIAEAEEELYQAASWYLTMLRYVERNPSRANLVERSQDWEWSSLTPTARRAPENLLSEGPVPKPSQWTRIVNGIETEGELKSVQRSIDRGTPFGDSAWQNKTAAQNPTRIYPDRQRRDRCFFEKTRIPSNGACDTGGRGSRRAAACTCFAAQRELRPPGVQRPKNETTKNRSRRCRTGVTHQSPAVVHLASAPRVGFFCHWAFSRRYEPSQFLRLPAFLPFPFASTGAGTASSSFS
jgi:hypothetical protein